jgi:hypothetical protein
MGGHRDNSAGIETTGNGIASRTSIALTNHGRATLDEMPGKQSTGIPLILNASS